MDTQSGYQVLIHTPNGVEATLADAFDACIPLPRLTPLEQTAPYVLGAFDLYGDLVPVISLGLLRDGRTPIATSTDLVLVVTAGAFPLGLHTARPLRIETRPVRPGDGRGPRVTDLRRLRLTAADDDAGADAECRLARFERDLTGPALRRLEQRARHYRVLPPGQAASAPVATRT